MHPVPTIGLAATGPRAAIVLITTKAVPIEEELTHNLCCRVDNKYIPYNCPESVELRRRLCAGLITVDDLCNTFGGIENAILGLARSGQWPLMYELFERIDWESINLHRLCSAYRRILARSAQPPGTALEALQALHARGIISSDTDGLLQLAARYHDEDVARFIVETLGATVNTLNRALCWCSGSNADTASPLCTAVYFANVRVVRYLLTVNADVALQGVSSHPGCVHAPLEMINVLMQWIETTELPKNSIHPYTAVPDPAAALAEIAEMLFAMPPHDDQALA